MPSVYVPKATYGLSYTGSPFGSAALYGLPAKTAFTANIPETQSIGTQALSKVTDYALKKGTSLAKDYIASQFASGASTAGTASAASQFGSAATFGETATAALGSPSISTAGIDSLAAGLGTETATTTATTAAAPTATSALSTAASGLASTVGALGPALAIFQGLKMLDTGVGATEISEAVNTSGDQVTTSDMLQKRVTGEHRDLVARKALPDFTNTINSLKESGVDTSSTQYRLGFQGGERGTLGASYLIKNLLPGEEGQAAFEKYNQVRKEVMDEHTKEAQDLRMALGRGGANRNKLSPEQLAKEGQIEPEIGYIEAKDKYGNTQRFNYLNLDDEITARSPELAELARKSKEEAFKDMSQFASGSRGSVLPSNLGAIPEVTQAGQTGTAYDIARNRSIGNFSVPTVTARKAQKETNFSKFLKEYRNNA